MSTVKTIAIINDGLTATATISGAISSSASIRTATIKAAAVVLGVLVIASASLLGEVKTTAKIISSGINSEPQEAGASYADIWAINTLANC